MTFWPRELIFATPNPGTAQGSRAPLCPCAACFKAPPTTVKPGTATTAPAPEPKKKRKTRRGLLAGRLRPRASLDSLASDMLPLASAGQSPASSGDESVFELDMERA